MKISWKPFSFLLLACVFLPGCTGEKIETEIPLGITGEARRNPFLAAERFLEDMGVVVESHPTLYTLPEPYLDPVLVTTSDYITRGRVEDLKTWVDYGGNLVLMVNNNESAEMNNLGGLWDFFFRNDSGPSEETIDFLRQFGITLDGEEPGQSRIKLRNERIETNIRSKSWLAYEGRPARSMAIQGSVNGAGIMRLESGSGTLTVLSGKRPFSNAGIGDVQHARLLWRLAGSSAVTLLYRPLNLSFWGLLWSKGKWAVIALGILVLLWLARNLRRFGPLKAPADVSNRDFIEHVDNTGTFFWNHNRPELLVTPMRESVKQKMEARYGRVNDPAIESAAERSGVTSEQIHYALYEPVQRKRNAKFFVSIVQILQKLEQSL